MFNLLPGQGLGFSGSKDIAFGLAAYTVKAVVPPTVIEQPGGGTKVAVLGNAYSAQDNDILELLTILFRVIP